MSRIQYFRKRLMKMDWKAMWKTTGLLKKRSGKSRLWLMTDMLKCGIKYNAGYIDYKIAQMYKLNDDQRKTVITRGISNEIVPFDTLAELGSMAACKEKGLVRSEGKDYVMKDGDITLFRFNV